MKRWLIAALIVTGAGGVAWAQQATESEEQLTTKQQAIRWIDRFAIDQVLFHAEDVKKLREKVAGMSDEEVQKWWDDTAVRRELLDSPEWADTQRWLKEFLKVQAIYSDEDIKFFQSEAFAKAKESPRSLKEAMDEVNALRQRLRAGAQLSAQTREQVLASQEAYRQEAVRQRETMMRQAARPSVGVGTQPVQRPPRTRYNQPLVTSLDAARWTIIRDFFPRW